jgi:hypothetical protein
LLAALVACLVLSYRCERANIYLRQLWQWLEGTSKNPPGRFDDFPRIDVISFGRWL